MQVFDRETVSKLVFRGRNGISSATWKIESEPGVLSEAHFEIGADNRVCFDVSERRNGERTELAAGGGSLDEDGSLRLTDEAADAFQIFIEALSLYGVSLVEFEQAHLGAGRKQK